MTKHLMVVHLGVAVLLLGAAGYSQQNSQSKPLGDVAREQKAASAGQKKSTSVHVDASDDAKVVEPIDASKAASAKPAVVQDVKANADKRPAMSQPSVMDRPMDEKPDPYVVPAGTEIRVDLKESKIVVPVRLGFATPVPALTKVAVQMDHTYFQNNYGVSGGNNPGYVEYATVTAVTVDGKTYAVQTNRVQVDGANTNPNGASLSSSRDAVFVLSAPVSIER